MTDALLVLRKLSLLREHTQRVRQRRPATLDAFRSDVDLQDATALSLVVAIQEALDIALHIAADEGWGVPASYAESFELLARHAVIDQQLAEELGRMAALRNRIVHGYASVALGRLWNEIPAGLQVLDSYAAAVAGFVGPPGP